MTIEEVVYPIESHLSIVMREHDDSETGLSFYWGSNLGASNGIQYYGITIQPTRCFDVEEQEEYLRRDHYEGFTFVIAVSDELTDEIARIQDLIRRDILEAEDITR